VRKTPQGVEYFRVNRRWPGSLPASKNHLEDSEDESDAKIFSVDLVENNCGTACLCVTWRSKFSEVFLQLQCANAQLLLHPMTQT